MVMNEDGHEDKRGTTIGSFLQVAQDAGWLFLERKRAGQVLDPLTLISSDRAQQPSGLKTNTAPSSSCCIRNKWHSHIPGMWLPWGSAIHSQLGFDFANPPLTRAFSHNESFDLTGLDDVHLGNFRGLSP